MEFFGHLDCVSKVLERGGLYLLDGVVRFNILDKHEERWMMRRGGISVRTTYRPELVDPLEQTCIEHVILEVDDHGRKSTLDSELGRKPSIVSLTRDVQVPVVSARRFAQHLGVKAAIGAAPFFDSREWTSDPQRTRGANAFLELQEPVV